MCTVLRSLLAEMNKTTTARTTSKINNSTAFSRAIFWRPRADEMGPEGRGPKIRIEGPGSR